MHKVNDKYYFKTKEYIIIDKIILPPNPGDYKLILWSDKDILIRSVIHRQVKKRLENIKNAKVFYEEWIESPRIEFKYLIDLLEIKKHLAKDIFRILNKITQDSKNEIISYYKNSLKKYQEDLLFLQDFVKTNPDKRKILNSFLLKFSKKEQ